MELMPIAVMFVLFALNVPVALAISMAALSFFFGANGIPMDTFVQKIMQSTQSYPLLAVPFFIFAGTIMNYSGITRRLLGFADVLVGHKVGGLAQANVILSTMMGGLSASANADAAMQAKMLGTEMVRRGYSPGFAAAVCTCSSVITPIIPPGIGLIMYGFLANVSIGRMFIGGIIPGLLLCLSLLFIVSLTAKQRNYAPTRTDRANGSETVWSFVNALGAISIIIFILLGIRSGFFTPTEAGALTVVYASLVGFLWYRELKIADFPKILRESVLATAIVMLIICGASALGFYFTWQQIPSQAATLLLGISENPLILLLLINAVLLVIGMLVEGTAALILITPILAPVIKDVGIDPVHFGILMVVNLTIGGVTPPVGTLMFTSCSILRVDVVDFVKEAWPLLLAMMGVLLLILFVPQTVTFLPNLLMN